MSNEKTRVSSVCLIWKVGGKQICKYIGNHSEFGIQDLQIIYHALSKGVEKNNKPFASDRLSFDVTVKSRLVIKL